MKKSIVILLLVCIGQGIYIYHLKGSLDQSSKGDNIEPDSTVLEFRKNYRGKTIGRVGGVDHHLLDLSNCLGVPTEHKALTEYADAVRNKTEIVGYFFVTLDIVGEKINCLYINIDKLAADEIMYLNNKHHLEKRIKTPGDGTRVFPAQLMWQTLRKHFKKDKPNTFHFEWKDEPSKTSQHPLIIILLSE